MGESQLKLKISEVLGKELPVWVTLSITLAVAAFLFILDNYIQTFNLKNVLWAVGLVSVSSLIGILVAHFTRSYQMKKDLCDLDKAIKSAQEITRIAMEQFGDSIITYHDLAEIERNVEEKGQIWILTSALELEEEEELAKIIRENFKKKIEYIYFIPGGDRNKILKEVMIKMALKWQSDCNLSKEEAQELIKCYLIPEHFAYMTVVIYNAQNKTKGKPPIVLVKFPASDTFKKEKYPLIYRVDTKTEEAWKTFVRAMFDFMVDPKCSQMHELLIDFQDEGAQGR